MYLSYKMQDFMKELTKDKVTSKRGQESYKSINFYKITKMMEKGGIITIKAKEKNRNLYALTLDGRFLAKLLEDLWKL